MSPTEPSAAVREAALLALSGELLGRIGADGRVQPVSAAWTRLLGDRPWPEIVHPDDRVAGFPDGLTCRMIALDGGEPVVRWRFAEAPDGVYAAGADVTAELRAQAELQDFAYIASHDLAEPLRMITSYLQLLQRRYGGQLDETADEFIGYAVGGATRMQALIDGLLAFSRVGTHELGIGAVDLADLVRHVLAGQERSIADAGAVVTAAESLPAARGDVALLGKLVGELVTNALRFGATTVSIAATERDDGVHVVVADDGIGIAEANHERVFKPFARLHGRDEYEGIGIGLAVCRRIAQRHGGRMTIESALGEGSRMGVWLPR